MQPRLAEQRNVVDGVGLPSLRGRFGVEQPALHDGKLPRRQPFQLGGKLVHLAGGKKPCAAKIHSQHRLAVRYAGQSRAQQRAVTADRYDLIGGAVGGILRKKLHAVQPCLPGEGLRHQDGDAQPDQHGGGLPRDGKPGVLRRIGDQ